jgi:pimeloyl-ACP methyl ester carboxylesterase
MRIRNVVLALAAVTAGAAAAYLATVATTGLGIPTPAPGRARPSKDPADARELFARARARDSADVDPRCHSKLYTPGVGVAPKASIVLFHGFTNCPAQFDPTAKVLAEAGYAVYVPRAPFHGMNDGLYKALVDLKIDDLIASVNSAIDIAAGLGGPVWVAGLSTGGTLAAWAGATRHEVQRVVSMAPVISPMGLPMPAARLMALAEPIVPADFYNWWDWNKKADLVVAPYSSPGFPARSILPFIHLGQTLVDRRVVPNHQLRRAALVLNPDDVAISAEASRLMMQHTFSGFSDSLVELDLAGGKGWGHDYVDQSAGVDAHATPEEIAGFIEKGFGGGPTAGALAPGLVTERSLETAIAAEAPATAHPTTAPRMLRG